METAFLEPNEQRNIKDHKGRSKMKTETLALANSTVCMEAHTRRMRLGEYKCHLAIHQAQQATPPGKLKHGKQDAEFHLVSLSSLQISPKDIIALVLKCVATCAPTSSRNGPRNFSKDEIEALTCRCVTLTTSIPQRNFP